MWEERTSLFGVGVGLMNWEEKLSWTHASRSSCMYSVSLLLTKDVMWARLQVPALTSLPFMMNYNLEVLTKINPISPKLLFVQIFSQQQKQNYNTMPEVFFVFKSISHLQWLFGFSCASGEPGWMKRRKGGGHQHSSLCFLNVIAMWPAASHTLMTCLPLQDGLYSQTVTHLPGDTLHELGLMETVKMITLWLWLLFYFLWSGHLMSSHSIPETMKAGWLTCKEWDILDTSWFF